MKYQKGEGEVAIFIIVWIIAAWLTHIVVCLKAASWVFLVSGALFCSYRLDSRNRHLAWGLVMQYQSGQLTNPKESDPTFNTYSEAILHVTHASETQPQGVWTGQEDGSELVAIIWEREAYTT